MLEELTADDIYLQKILFFEAIFHTYDVINCHNCRIWGSENLHALMEHLCNSPKVNMWCGILSDHTVGPFFFHVSTIMSAVCLDVLHNFLFPQIIGEVDSLIFQQDGASAYYCATVRHSSG
jgi:hypothetical protein